MSMIRVLWEPLNSHSMIIRYCIALSVLVLSACTLSGPVVTPDKTHSWSLDQTGGVLTGAVSPTETGNVDIQNPLVENLSGSGDYYSLIFQGLETRIIPIQHRSGSGTFISFINSEAKSMHVNVSFPGTAIGNLRLTQIIMPDGTMDGPFGTDSVVPLTQLGGYTLRFSENQMSGEPWSGKAIIILALSAR